MLLDFFFTYNVNKKIVGSIKKFIIEKLNGWKLKTDNNATAVSYKLTFYQQSRKQQGKNHDHMTNIIRY